MNTKKNSLQHRCVHCLQTPEDITDDHVIPESWYSTGSRSQQKPTAPACLECNASLGEKEKFLSHIMWLSMPADHPLTPELRTKVFRACGMTPDGGPLPDLSPKERRIRVAYCKKLMMTTVPASSEMMRRSLPGFGPHKGYPGSVHRGTYISQDDLSDVAKKITRGIEYRQGGRNRYIEPPYRIEVFFPRDLQDEGLSNIRKICKPHFDGTNTIQRGAVFERPMEPIYIFRIWDQWEIWALIFHEDRDFSSLL